MKRTSPRHKQTVIIVAEMLGYGGMSTFVAETAGLLKRHGYRIVIVTATSHPDDADFQARFARADHVHHVTIDAYRGVRNKAAIVFHSIVLVVRALRAHPGAVLLCVGPLATAGIAPLLWLLRIPRLFFFLSPLDLEIAMNEGISNSFTDRIRSRVLYWITRLGLTAFPSVLTYSEYAKNLIRQYYHIRKPIYLIPGFISVPDVKYSGSPQASLVRSARTFTFLFPSRFEPWKRPELILQALPYVRHRKYRIIFCGYSDHRHKEKWQSWIRSHKLDQHVNFLPHLPKAALYRLYAASDCVLFPSVNLEMFGYVALEAFTVGTPVLGSNEGAIPELLGRVDKRLVIPDANPKTIAAAMTWMMHLTARERRILSKRSKAVAVRYNGADNTNNFVSLVAQAAGK